VSIGLEIVEQLPVIRFLQCTRFKSKSARNSRGQPIDTKNLVTMRPYYTADDFSGARIDGMYAALGSAQIKTGRVTLEARDYARGSTESDLVAER
jgi:hypothetical protein